jgi:S1-C subfamily serine protease
MLVADVTPNGPAARAGIRRGDVIAVFDGKPMDDGNTLRNRVASTPPGTQATLTVIRDGREQQVQVTLGEYQPRPARNEPTG